MESAINTQVSQVLADVFTSQFTTTAVSELLFGENGILRPNISREFWVGNYRIKIDIH